MRGGLTLFTGLVFAAAAIAAADLDTAKQAEARRIGGGQFVILAGHVVLWRGFERPEVTANPNVALLAPSHGGHVGFISANADGDKRFWAEVMIVEFVNLIAG